MVKEVAPEKKKLIRVECKGTPSPYDRTTTVGYAFVSSPDNGRKQCSDIVTCKDYLHEMIRGQVHGDSAHGCSMHNPKGSAPIDLTTLRLLIRHDVDDDFEDFKEKLFAGKRALNMYEAIAGWEQSKITTVKMTHAGKDVRSAWLLTGSKEWMKSPHLISLFALILRVSVNHGPLVFNDLTSLNKAWEAIIAKGGKDTEYIRRGYKLFPTIMQFESYIFSDPLNVAYPDKCAESFHSYGGIDALCCGNAISKEVSDRLKECAKKNNVMEG